MSYYIRNKRAEPRQGPFEVEELAQMHISKDTLVWSPGLHDWTKACEVLELIDIVATSPVPPQKRIDYLLWKLRN